MVVGLLRPPLPTAPTPLTLLLSPASGRPQRWPDGLHPQVLAHTWPPICQACFKRQLATDSGFQAYPRKPHLVKSLNTFNTHILESFPKAYGFDQPSQQNTIWLIHLLNDGAEYKQFLDYWSQNNTRAPIMPPWITRAMTTRAGIVRWACPRRTTLPGARLFPPGFLATAYTVLTRQCLERQHTTKCLDLSCSAPGPGRRRRWARGLRAQK